MTRLISTDDIQAKTVEMVGLMLFHFRNDLLAQSFYRFSQTPFEITTKVNEQFERGAKEISSFFLEDEQIGLEAKSQALKNSILLFSDKAGLVVDLVRTHGKFAQDRLQQKDALTKEHQDRLAEVKEADRILNRVHTKFANENLKHKQDNIKVDIDDSDVALLFDKNINFLLDHARQYIKESVVDLERETLGQDATNITVPHMGVNLFLEEEAHKAKSAHKGLSL